MEVLTERARKGLPWELMYADYVALMALSGEGLQRRVLEWQKTTAKRGTQNERREVGSDGVGKRWKDDGKDCA